MSEDLYQLLGVSRSASEADIKKAYKKKAREYHPDVNKEAGAEETFKKIQKAYAVLSDPQRKQQYDQFGVADDSAAGGGAGAGFGGFGGGFSSEGFEDIFDAFFGGARSRGGRRGPVQGDDLRYDLEITLEEAATGIEKEVDIYHLASCDPCHGSGQKSGTSKTSCQKCHGTGQVKVTQQTFLGSFSQVSTCPACHGVGNIIKDPCTNCHGKGIEKKKKKINITVPKGVESGVKLRISGEGNAGEEGGPPGDLYVFITVKPHKDFERINDDVEMKHYISYADLILGTTVQVPTLTGDAKLKIPAGTQSGTKFRLKGKGIPHLQSYGSGDQYVIIQADIPKSPSKKELDLIKQIKAL